MRLENVLALTNGELVNTPVISEFNSIVFDVKHVRRGDLFIAFEHEMIEEAVANGAYGIVFEKPTQIFDSEIAWIKRENLDDVLQRLLRFELIEKDIHVYQTNEIVLKLAFQLLSEPSFIPLSGDIRNVYKQLQNVQNGDTVLFCPALTSADIFTHIKEMPLNRVESINIVEQTLFESSFIYDNIFYERQLISPFFIPYLEQLFHLLKISKINFRLKKFTPIEHFEAVFTNKKFEIKEFGTSDRVLIFEKSISFMQDEIEYLQKQASWAKILYVLPEHTLVQIDTDSVHDQSGIIGYEHEDQIVPLLRKHSFHFALIIGVDKTILNKPSLRPTQKTLFDF